eukprot:1160277-Pelagomonas_calceolata.AAC.12
MGMHAKEHASLLKPRARTQHYNFMLRNCDGFTAHLTVHIKFTHKHVTRARARTHTHTHTLQGAGHNRNRSIATRDAGGARDAIAAALAAEPGICLTETMCVVRCTLQQKVLSLGGPFASAVENSENIGRHVRGCMCLDVLTLGRHQAVLTQARTS